VILWRATRHPSLDGNGGLRVSGRWHTRGRRIVYCAPNPTTALLELLVHAEIDLEDLPIAFRYLEIEAPDALATASAGAGVPISGGENDVERTRRAGDEWLRAGRTALLQVPCALVPATWNTLLNPEHPDSRQIRIVRTHRWARDPRLRR
jgi:RES domain-containing protein